MTKLELIAKFGPYFSDREFLRNADVAAHLRSMPAGQGHIEHIRTEDGPHAVWMFDRMTFINNQCGYFADGYPIHYSQFDINFLMAECFPDDVSPQFEAELELEF